MRKMQLCSLWACTFLLPKALTSVSASHDDSGASDSHPLLALGSGPLCAAHVKNSATLSWISNTSRKISGNSREIEAGVEKDKEEEEEKEKEGEGEYESWTLLSTRDYASANKCSQENIPPDVRTRVEGQMLAEFEKALAVPKGSLAPHTVHVMLQVSEF